MDMSLWESLLKDVEDLKAKPPSAANTAKIQSLLTQVANLTGGPAPAGQGGDGKASSVVAKGGGSRPAPFPITMEGQKDAVASIPPPPEFGSNDVTAQHIADVLENGGKNKDWDAKIVGAWGDLAARDHDKARRLWAEGSKLRDAQAKSTSGPKDEENDWINGTAAAKILPEGKLTVVVNSVAPKDGPALPPGSVRVSDKDMTPDEMMATLHGIAANISDRTDQERETATALAYRLERLREKNPKAYGKLPAELQRFSQYFKEQMDEERAGIKPKNPNDKTIELPADTWEKMTKNAADHAMRRTVRSFALNPFMDRIQDIPKEYRDDPVLKTMDAADRIWEFAKKFIR